MDKFTCTRAVVIHVGLLHLQLCDNHVIMQSCDSHVTYSVTLHTEQVLKRECDGLPSDGLEEARLNMVPLVGGVAVTTVPLHPGMGE